MATKFPNPQQDLHELLDIATCAESKQWPDLYFIGYVPLFTAIAWSSFGDEALGTFRLQEVKSQPQNIVLDYIMFEDPWTKAFR